MKFLNPPPVVLSIFSTVLAFFFSFLLFSFPFFFLAIPVEYESEESWERIFVSSYFVERIIRC